MNQTTLKLVEPEKMIDNVDKVEFLNAMRTVGNSVSVVTTDGAAGCHGGTVSSFCSVSVEPPIMLVCLNRDSQIAKLVEANGVFNVNILPEGSSQLGNRFAGAQDAELSDRFEGIEVTHNRFGPLLNDSTVISCEVSDITLAGTHKVMFGLVKSVLISDQAPLAYLAGQYHSLVPQEV